MPCVILYNEVQVLIIKVIMENFGARKQECCLNGMVLRRFDKNINILCQIGVDLVSEHCLVILNQGYTRLVAAEDIYFRSKMSEALF